MDLSDDIAYSVHDVEDGVVGGWFTLDLDSLDASAVHGVARDWYDAGLDGERLSTALERLEAMPEWPREPLDQSRASRAVLKSLTSALIGRFVIAAQSATVQRWGTGPLVRYAADLEVPDRTRDEITVLKSVAAHYVMRADDSRSLSRPVSYQSRATRCTADSSRDARSSVNQPPTTPSSRSCTE